MNSVSSVWYDLCWPGNERWGWAQAPLEMLTAGEVINTLGRLQVQTDTAFLFHWGYRHIYFWACVWMLQGRNVDMELQGKRIRGIKKFSKCCQTALWGGSRKKNSSIFLSTHITRFLKICQINGRNFNLHFPDY